MLKYWSGQGAEGYRGALEAQSEVLRGFEEPLRQISNALAATASTISNFYTHTGVAVGGLLTGMVAAFAASGTIVGIPAGIVVAIGACVAYLAAALQIASNAHQGAQDQTRAFIDAHGSAGVPSDWPQVGAVSGDGSASDGDPSDWSTEPS